MRLVLGSSTSRASPSQGWEQQEQAGGAGVSAGWAWFELAGRAPVASAPQTPPTPLAPMPQKRGHRRESQRVCETVSNGMRFLLLISFSIGARGVVAYTVVICLRGDDQRPTMHPT